MREAGPGHPPEDLKALSLSEGNAWPKQALARVYPLVGQRAKAEAILQEMLKDAHHRSDTEIQIASVYAALGDKDQAFVWLEKAYQNRDGALILLKVSPSYDPLRLDPRFADLERRVGLPL
jgi:tetratricopeptide (TPR) repeat protein